MYPMHSNNLYRNKGPAQAILGNSCTDQRVIELAKISEQSPQAVEELKEIPKILLPSPFKM